MILDIFFKKDLSYAYRPDFYNTGKIRMSDEEIQKCLVFGWRAVIVGSALNQMSIAYREDVIKHAKDYILWSSHWSSADTFAVLDLLMQDTDRNVKKKVGWTLRVGSKFFPKETYNFLFHWAKTGNKDTKWIIKNGIKFIDENKKKILLKMLSNC